MELENELDLLANQFRHAKNFYVSNRCYLECHHSLYAKTDVSLNKEITTLKLKRDGIKNEGTYV